LRQGPLSRLKDRVAIVTGAARGIGEGIARVMAREGAVVALWDILESGEGTAESVHRSGHVAVFTRVDVSDPARVADAAQGLRDRFGRIDILVNNAGIASFAPFVDMTEEARDRVFHVNFNGVWNCTKAVLPGMLEQQYGRIINVSSVTGPRVGDPGLSAYSATKGAVCGRRDRERDTSRVYRDAPDRTYGRGTRDECRGVGEADQRWDPGQKDGYGRGGRGACPVLGIR